MGRTEPSKGLAPPLQRRSQRARRARDTLNRTVPGILARNFRARAGVDAAELIIDPAPLSKSKPPSDGSKELKEQRKAGRKRAGRRAGEDDEGDEESQQQQQMEDLKKKRGSKHGEGDTDTVEAPVVRIMLADTLTAASSLTTRSTSSGGTDRRTAFIKKQNVAVLNMASPLRAGGGFLSGATSQEESLCMRTSLLPSLREEFYRLPDVGGVWTPDVFVFRGGNAEARDLPFKERYWVDVISAGAIRFPETLVKVHQGARPDRGVYKAKKKEENNESEDEDEEEEVWEEHFLSDKDRALVLRKMRAVLRILQSKDAKKVVLGAWGCGAYGNPVADVSKAWREAILGSERSRQTNKRQSDKEEKWFGLEEIVFAITQRSMAVDFAEHWPNIDVETLDSQDSYESEHEGDDFFSEATLREIHELETKIAELNIQISQARMSTLKSGLEGVRQRLTERLSSITGDGRSEDDASEDEEDAPVPDVS